MASPPQRQHTQTPTRPSAEPNRPGSQVEATKIIPLLNQLENVARQLLPYREKLPRVDEIWEKNAKLKQEASGLREENTTLTAAVTRAALTQEQYIQSSERERKGALAKQNETENKLQEVVKMNSGLRKELDSLKQRFVDKGEVAAAVEKERAKHEREMKSKTDKFGKEMKDAQAKLKAAEIKIKLVQDNLDKQQRLLTGTELNLESYRKELENTKKDLCIEELDKDLL
jgi:chromosome segregation ATPase